MSGRIFLDTNVFVYALSKSVPSKQVIASRLLKDAIESGRGTISFQVVQEFFNVAFRRFTPPMTTVDAEQFLTVTLRPLLAVQSSYGLYMQALQLTRGHSLSWYDSLLVAAALESDCRTLYTEDLQHGQTFDSLRIVNPFL
jgi:predicted nucleic acid-binding protein